MRPIVSPLANTNAKTMTTLLLQVLAISACLLHAHTALSSETDVCVESIDMYSGTIVYSNENHSQFIEYFDNVCFEDVMVIISVTAPSGVDVNETRTYQVSKTYLSLQVSLHLIDLMSFSALNLVERTQETSVYVPTFVTCANESWQKLLYDGFVAGKGDGFARLLQACNVTLYDTILTSGMLYLALLGTTSVLAMYVVLFLILDVNTASVTCDKQSSRHPGALSGVFATTHSLNLGIYTVYLAYILFCTVSYYVNLADESALLAYYHKQYIVTPYASNAVTLSTTVCLSYLVGLRVQIPRQRFSCILKVGTACSVSLSTAAFYHLPFLLLVLFDDSITAFCSLLFLATVLVCAYTLIAAAVQLYRVVKSTSRFFALCTLLVLIPLSYFVTIKAGKPLFNAGYVYLATEFWLVVVLFVTTLTWILCFYMLASAFKRKGSPLSCPQNRMQDDASADPEEGLTTKVYCKHA